LAQKIYSKEIPSDPDLMPEVEDFVLDIAKSLNLAPDKYNNLALSVAEAISNSMKHGNKNDENKKVKINIYVDDDVLKISFKDEGPGFEPKDIPDPTKPENILKDSGRGLHIMRSFLDDLQFKFHDDGTEIILVMKLNKN
jgi:serine/threonine-protein kinase RsbW